MESTHPVELMDVYYDTHTMAAPGDHSKTIKPPPNEQWWIQGVAMWNAVTAGKQAQTKVYLGRSAPEKNIASLLSGVQPSIATQLTNTWAYPGKGPYTNEHTIQFDFYDNANNDVLHWALEIRRVKRR